MADIDQTIEFKPRQTVRKQLANLRNAGMVPGVVHNHGQQSVYLEAPELELSRIYREAGKHHPLQIKVGDQEFLALIKDVHLNPVKQRIQHIVFQAIRQDEKVEAEVPIRLEGEIPAEKAGLMVLRQLDAVEIEALPRNLPDELVADATKLVELHDKITVADLPVPEGVTILTEAEHPIATVAETPAQVSEEAEAAEGDAEGETGEEAAGEGGEASAETPTEDAKE